MSDLVKRLRVAAKWPYNINSQNEGLMEEAAARIEALEKALRPFASVTVLPNGAAVGMERHWFSDARAALEERT